MKIFITLIINVIIVPYLVVLINKHLKTRNTESELNDDGNIVMKPINLVFLSKGGLIVSSVISFVFGMSFVIFSIIGSDSSIASTSAWVMPSRIICGTIGGLLCLFPLFLVKAAKGTYIEYNQYMIRQSILLRKEKKILWDELDDIETQLNGDVIVFISGNTKIQIATVTYGSLANLLGFLQNSLTGILKSKLDEFISYYSTGMPS